MEEWRSYRAYRGINTIKACYQQIWDVTSEPEGSSRPIPDPENKWRPDLPAMEAAQSLLYKVIGEKQILGLDHSEDDELLKKTEIAIQKRKANIV